MTTQEHPDTIQESSVDRVRARIQEGRLGKNLGLAFHLKQIDNVLYGIQQARYYLVGADSGCGKSSIVDFLFVLKAYFTAVEQCRAFVCFYYSFEISEEEKIAKWICTVVKVLHDLDLHVDYVMGRISGMTVSDVDQVLIDEALEVITDVLKHVIIIDTTKNPTAIFTDVIEYAESIGKVIRKVVVSKKKKDDNGNFVQTKYITGFIPNDPDQITIIVLDHVALATPEQGMDTKSTIDLLSKYFVFIRNKFRFSIVAVQQFNAELQSVERRKFKAAALAPGRNDFGDSKYTYRDADVVLGGLMPSMFDISEFYGYSILPGAGNSRDYYFGNYLVMWFLMKNRYGKSGIPFALFMNGMAGTFTDLPRATEENEFTLESMSEERTRLETINEWYCPKSQ